MADDNSKNELAEDRTDWAEDRTVLANERTFAGWMRTGMASVAVAIGLQAVFGETEPTWIARSVATLFCLIGTFIFYQAWRNCCATIQRLDSHATNPVTTNRMGVLASLFSVASLAVAGIMWIV